MEEKFSVEQMKSGLVQALFASWKHHYVNMRAICIMFGDNFPDAIKDLLATPYEELSQEVKDGLLQDLCDLEVELQNNCSEEFKFNPETVLPRIYKLIKGWWSEVFEADQDTLEKLEELLSVEYEELSAERKAVYLVIVNELFV